MTSYWFAAPLLRKNWTQIYAFGEREREIERKRALTGIHVQELK